jgi:DNA-binding MarR family transcriptional regulator
VRALERKGLVTREVDADDTRARRVGVTNRGARLAPRAIAVVEEVDARFFAPVSGRDALRLLRPLAEPTLR